MTARRATTHGLLTKLGAGRETADGDLSYSWVFFMWSDEVL